MFCDKMLNTNVLPLQWWSVLHYHNIIRHKHLCWCRYTTTDITNTSNFPLWHINLLKLRKLNRKVRSPNSSMTSHALPFGTRICLKNETRHSSHVWAVAQTKLTITRDIRIHIVSSKHIFLDDVHETLNHVNWWRENGLATYADPALKKIILGKIELLSILCLILCTEPPW